MAEKQLGNADAEEVIEMTLYVLVHQSHGLLHQTPCCPPARYLRALALQNNSSARSVDLLLAQSSMWNRVPETLGCLETALV